MRTPWGDRVCRCECHRDGDEDHRECCTWLAQRERDDAQSRIDAALAIRKEMLDPLWPSLTPDELMTRVEEALLPEGE